VTPITPIRLLLVIAALTSCLGCSSLNPISRVETEVEPPLPSVAAADTAAVAVEAPPAETEPPLIATDPVDEPSALESVLEDRPDLNELDHLYRQALQLLAHRQFEPAEDVLYLLREEAVATVPADRDSVAAAYLSSLERRVSLLAGVVAEEHALDMSVVPDDSLLGAAYAGVRGLAFPDSLIPVSGSARRTIETDLLAVNNDAVQRWIDYFSGDGKRHFELWLERKAAVDSLIYAELDAAGLPRELIYLSAIESGFNPNARSSANAVGPWQFMAGTARHFKLRCDWWVDERRDILMSTQAAAKYLSQLYNHFEDWALVLAAYNAGEGRVDRAIKRGAHDNFWDLHLPGQTRNHIPKFIAVARLGENPDAYGLTIADNPDLSFDIVDVTDATDLDLIARCAGVPAAEVHALNTGLIRGATPPGKSDYPVKVPRGTGRACMKKLKKIPLDERLTWRRHTVRPGETLGAIARKFGTTVGDVSRLNKIHNVALIHPGDKLLIPMPGALAERVAGRAKEAGHYVPPQGYERSSYKVKSGDTLSGIARKLGVTLSHLRRVNNMHKSSFIKPGQRLYVYRPSRS